MASSGGFPSKVQDDVQRYVKGKRLDALVSTIIEDLIKYRPSHIATYVFDFIVKKFPEDSKHGLGGKVVTEMMTKMYTGRSPTDYTVKSYLVTVKTDVQLELDQYLQEKGVGAFMTALMEKVLLAEAQNPYTVIFEFICEQYPEQAILALEMLNPPKNTSKAVLAKNIAEQMNLIDEQHKNLDIDSDMSDEEKPTPRKNAMKKEESEEEEEDPDEDKDTFNAEASNALQQGNPNAIKAYRRNRRVSVSSESIDPNKLKEDLANVKIIPKSDEVMQQLFHVVSRSPMLRRMLGPEERTLIIKAFDGPIIKQPDEFIIQQGEEGETFYLIESGTVNVYVKRVLDDEAHVHTYHDGDTFGQLALMYNAPRAATCKAATEVKLWTLDRHAFKAIITGAVLRKREMYMAFLAHVPILQTLGQTERLTLADALTEEKYEAGASVCDEGDVGNDFYIILDGMAEVYQKNTVTGTLSPRMIATLTRGDYFGEIALLTNKPRQATVKAVNGILKVLVIDRSTFTRVFGSMEAILKRNMETYERYSAATKDNKEKDAASTSTGATPA